MTINQLLTKAWWFHQMKRTLRIQHNERNGRIDNAFIFEFWPSHPLRPLRVLRSSLCGLRWVETRLKSLTSLMLLVRWTSLVAVTL